MTTESVETGTDSIEIVTESTDNDYVTVGLVKVESETKETGSERITTPSIPWIPEIDQVYDEDYLYYETKNQISEGSDSASEKACFTWTILIGFYLY